MLSELFYWIINAGILGSFVGLLVLILRRIRILPKFSVYVLWFLPFIRFWMPFGVANKYSILSIISRFTTKTVVIREDLPQFTASNSLMLADSYFPLKYKTDLIKNILNVVSLFWIIVSFAAILTSILLYLFTKSELKSAKYIRNNIYKSDKISVPAVYGIIRPKIILPSSLPEGDLDYIIQHENVHIKRRDNLLRVVAVITACVHWFNPLSWIFLKYFFIDMELACDAKVLKSLNKNGAKEYARAILTCASGKTLFVSAFGGAKTRVRIENILSYKKLTVLSSIFFAAIVVFIAFIMITNAAV